MQKLCENAKKEILAIEQEGLNAKNIDLAQKLTSIVKNIKKIEKEEDMMMRDRYMGDRYMGDYGRGGDYSAYIEGRYDRDHYGRDMGRGGNRYGHERFYDRWDRVADDMDKYFYGRDRYMNSGDTTKMQDGLDKMMYGICTFVEVLFDSAETPEEKEIIRKHVQKLKNF